MKLIRHDCRDCHCPLFERVGNCRCDCHVRFETLKRMSGGDIDAVKRDFLSTTHSLEDLMRNDPETFLRLAQIADSKRDVRDLSISDMLLIQNTFNRFRKEEDKKAREEVAADLVDILTPEQIIKHEIFTGIKFRRLPNGFILDDQSYRELVKVLTIAEPRDRVGMCITYLAGYDRGINFSGVR